MTLIDIPSGVDRFRPKARARQDWYRIQAKTDGDTAEVWIYDEIGYWGITAADFSRELAGVDAKAITLHLNTPGGDVFDGIAIANSLRDHPATVTVVVDALAASIGSVIAMAGDRVVMNQQSQMMIHDAWGMCIGNAADMTDMASTLDRLSGAIAGAYADRAGGTVAMWRDQMRAETWFDAQEAVDAGLADEVAQSADKSAQQAAARWNLAPRVTQRPAAKAGRRPQAALVLTGQDVDYLRCMIGCQGAMVDESKEFLKLPAEQRSQQVANLAQRVADGNTAMADEMTALLDDAGLPVEPDQMDMSFAGRPSARSTGGSGSENGPGGHAPAARHTTTTARRDQDALRLRGIL